MERDAGFTERGIRVKVLGFRLSGSCASRVSCGGCKFEAHALENT